MEGRGYNGNHNSAQRLMHRRERSEPKPVGGLPIRSVDRPADDIPPAQGPSREVLRRNYLIPPRQTDSSADTSKFT